MIAAAIANADCGDPVLIVTTLEKLVIEGRFAEAEVARTSLVEAFGCGPPAEPPVVARLWLAEATLLAARGEQDASDNALASAARLSPGTWNDLYGPTLKGRWEEVSHRPPPPIGQLRIEPLAGYLVSVDGAPLSVPAVLSAGLHLLQVGTDSERSEIARVIDLPPGLDLVLDLGLSALASPPTAPVVDAPALSVVIHTPPGSFDAIQLNCGSTFSRRESSSDGLVRFEQIPDDRCMAYFVRGSRSWPSRVEQGDELVCLLRPLTGVYCAPK